MRNKKGIYFTIEAVIAMMVISVGFAIILYLFVILSKPPVSIVQTELYDTAELFSLSIQDIQEGTCSATGRAVIDDNITDTSNSFFTQLGEFYYRYTTQNCDYCDDLISLCIEDFINYRNLEQQNLEVRIEGVSFYKNGTIDQENATTLFPFKVILFGSMNTTAVWGPYVGEIRVWH